MEVVNDMIDENKLNATILRFRQEYPAAILDRQAIRALLEAYEQSRLAALPMNKLERVAMALAAKDFEGEQAEGMHWTEEFEDSGLYAAQCWDIYSDMAHAAIAAMEMEEKP